MVTPSTDGIKMLVNNLTKEQVDDIFIARRERLIKIIWPCLSDLKGS